MSHTPARHTFAVVATASAAIALGLTGCSVTGTQDPAATTSAQPVTTGTTVDAAEDFPRTVTNCGREVTIEAKPARVVGVEGGAETVFALGAADQMAGYFGNEAQKLPGALGEQAATTQHLGGSFPAPTLEALLESEPDLLVLYSLYPDAGITAERLDELGVPFLLLSEACDTHADPTVEGYFGDVSVVGTALGVDDVADELVAGWRTQIAEATAEPVDGLPTVFVMGSPNASEPFTSGGSSLANDQIAIAGGQNLYADADDAFLTPSWEETASRNPDVIVDGSGGMQESMEALRTYLTEDDALSQMTAVRDDAFLVIDYYDNVPGPRVIDGIVKIAEFLRQ